MLFDSIGVWLTAQRCMAVFNAAGIAACAYAGLLLTITSWDPRPFIRDLRSKQEQNPNYCDTVFASQLMGFGMPLVVGGAIAAGLFRETDLSRLQAAAIATVVFLPAYYAIGAVGRRAILGRSAWWWTLRLPFGLLLGSGWMVERLLRGRVLAILDWVAAQRDRADVGHYEPRTLPAIVWLCVGVCLQLATACATVVLG